MPRASSTFLLDEHHGEAAVTVEPADHLGDLLDDARRQPEEGLVDHEEVGAGQ
jgi:hypothetical protein